MKPVRLLSMLGVAALAFAVPFSAGATVKKEGSWPGVEKKVDLEFEGKPSDGLKRLAKEAGWSLVVAKGVAVDGDGAEVHVAVDEQPADAVLEALFVGHDVVAHRNGTLITVTPASSAGTNAPNVAAVPAAPALRDLPSLPAPPATPMAPVLPAPAATPMAPVLPAVRGEDRNIFGGSLVIHKDEVVHTVTVAGGSLKVEGTITGDLVIAGGSAKILSGGRVVGNATVFGGSLKVEKDGRIDGDVGIAGGSLRRAEGAIIGGRIVDQDHGGQVELTAGDDGTTTEQIPSESPRRSRLAEAAQAFGQSVTRMALLFVLGSVLLALLAPRMETLRVEIASRPMRSFAVGLVGTVLGTIGAVIALTILCVTIIGIPLALVGVLLGVIAVYGAVAAALTTFGAAVIGHRTQNPYLHLLLGCAAFLVLSSIPWIGGAVSFAVVMIAVGALVTTRVGGLVERRRRAM
ncbi:MAG: polymer-forming cytoskeletal protein [Myxococcales bacterium]|nr:polymer-forming cytoskeletal protein [Myxococcales bacterium]